MLDAAGFEVHLINARHVKNVPGRKSDVLDCQWLQQQMSYGLPRGGLRPAEEVCALRAVWRHRDMLLSYQARHVQHLQKAMTQMNVRLHHVISDIMGVTAQAIIRAIVAGERDGKLLLGARKGHAPREAGLGTPKRSTPPKNSVRFESHQRDWRRSGTAKMPW